MYILVFRTSDRAYRPAGSPTRACLPSTRSCTRTGTPTPPSGHHTSGSKRPWQNSSTILSTLKTYECRPFLFRSKKVFRVEHNCFESLLCLWLSKKSNLRNQKTLNVYIQQILSDREHINWGRSPSGPEPEQQLVWHYKKWRTNDLSNKASPYILRSFSN